MRLAKGVHLHFILPDCLTHGKLVETPDAPGKSYAFPPVPNHWVVTRKRAGHDDVSWIVESDRLVDTGEGVAIPVDPGPRRPPYARIGMQYRKGQQPATAAQYLEHVTGKRLNALGWGDPNFSSLYSNCHSVFGAHDPDGGQIDGVADTYTVVGTYRSHDPIATAADFGALARDWGLEPQVRQDDGKFRPWDKTKDAAPGGLACYGVTILDAQSANTSPSAPPKIIMAHTGTEALAAAIAGHDHDFEDQLAAALYAPDLDAKNIDHGPLYGERRHREGFVAEDGGVVWRIVPAKDAGTADATRADPERRLDPALIKPLTTLNTAQDRYNQIAAHIRSMRMRLHLQWCRYLQCLYPGQDEPALDPDDLKSLMENETVRYLPVRSRLLRRLGVKIRMAVNALHGQMQAPDGTQTYRLEQAPAERFWRPRDPVVLLQGGLGAMSVAQQSHGPKAYCVDAPAAMNITPLRTHGREWHPLLMEWEVCYHPWNDLRTRPGGITGIPPKTIPKLFTFLDEEPTDLVHRDGGLAVEPHVQTGRTILSPHAVGTLRERLETFIADRARLDGYFKSRNIKTDGEVEAVRNNPADIATFYRSHVKNKLKISPEEATFLQRVINDVLPRLSDGMALSQAIGGFHDGLLQTKQGFQMPPSDPLASGDYQAFAKKVKALIGDQSQLGSHPQGHFAPLRAGAIGLSRIRLIDSFGRIHEQHEPDIHSAHSLTMKGVSVNGPDRGNGMAPASRLVLPARFSQAARLNFSFLAAGKTPVEHYDHPASSPIIGWIVPNYLDSAILVYDAAGNALTQIRDGRAHPMPTSVISRDRSVPLRQVVEWFKAPEPEFQAILSMLERAEDHIDPEGGYAEGDMALLAGRPIAIVRAKLSLEQNGASAVSQSWQSLRREIRGVTGDTGGIEQLNVPILLGDRRKLSDGLFGYWLDSDQPFQSRPLMMPLKKRALPATNKRVQTYTPASRNRLIQTSFAAGDVTMTMLLDPMGAVHATTGLLPTVKLALPHDAVARALSKLTVVFDAGPIISAHDEPVAVPVPLEGGYDWRWSEKHGARMRKPVKLAKPDEKANFKNRAAIFDGWLQLVPNEEDKS